jgi:hypothetical protein
MMKKNEIKIIIIIVAFAIVAYGIFYLYKSNNPQDIIQVIHHFDDREEIIMEFDANQNNIYTIDVELGQMTIEVKDGYYHVINVDCPNHNCEKMGYVNSQSALDVIICLPNGISIEPKGQSNE